MMLLDADLVVRLVGDGLTSLSWEMYLDRDVQVCTLSGCGCDWELVGGA